MGVYVVEIARFAHKGRRKEMTVYSNIVNPKKTLQSEQSHKDQQKNNAGGFSFTLDCWGRFRRFLILGAEDGTYYVGKRKLVLDNVKCIEECLKEDGVRFIKEIIEVSEAGRAPKNDPAVFALAFASGSDNLDVRKAALAALPRVCRIGTHLFHYAEDVEKFRRWGRGLRNAVAAWYTEKDPDKLALQVIKYRQRDGWSHKDLLRLSHAQSENEAHKAIFRWVATDGNMESRKVERRSKDGTKRHIKYDEIARENLPKLIHGFESLQSASTVDEVVELLKEYKLPHETLPTKWKNESRVWGALVDSGMPVTATIRNLAKMTSVGLVAPMSDATKKIVELLENKDTIQKSRVHPMQILTAFHIYGQGHGDKGSLTWQPVREILDALDQAFYSAFDNVEPTGKNHLLALDVSGSMTSPIMGAGTLSCRDASAAMALITARTEKWYEAVGFTSGGWGWGSNSKQDPDGLTKLKISGKMRLDSVIKEISGLPFGGTDCALPMIYATKHKLPVDTFVVYTDSETWAGTIHPHQALEEYRQKMSRDAKLIVVGMTSTEFTIANPNDPGMLDVVGFDTAAPALMAEFARGNL